MRYLILLISLIFLVSCSSGRTTVHVVDDQVKPIDIEPCNELKSLKESLEHEDYTKVNMALNQTPLILLAHAQDTH